VLEKKSFHLAPMTAGGRATTVLCLAIPLVIAASARSSPAAVGTLLFGAVGFMAVICASVWLFWRPTRFVIDDTGLRIEWPLRTRRILRAALGAAQVVSTADFRRDHGRGMRVGAGGIWGGFGLLVTRDETYSMWISRTDRFVIVRLAGARPLLITPEAPEQFVESLCATRSALA
jgi:hypothetical protein